MKPIQHILVATDFGESSARAEETALALAKRLDARLTLLHVYEIPALGLDGAVPFPTNLVAAVEDEAKQRLEERVRALRTELLSVDSVLWCGSPSEVILEVAGQRHAGLIVMGTHGRRGVSRALLGSVAERTVRYSKVPVLTVPAAAATETATPAASAA